MSDIIYFFIVLCILFYILFRYYSYIQKRYWLKEKRIISNIGDPYFIEESISPFTISFTSDLPYEIGGLSYTKYYTDQLNHNMIHDYYYREMKLQLPKDTKIIFGAGATMMVAALYYALQKKLQITIRATTNTNIFYILHKKLTIPLKQIEWIDNQQSSMGIETNNTNLAVIVSPQNPLGMITSPRQVAQPYMLYDVVYDKALFSGQFATLNPDLYEDFATNDNIFITSSFSKLGMPGGRFGYLLTRNAEIAEYCHEFVEIMSVRYPTMGATFGREAYHRYFKDPAWQMRNYHILQERIRFFLEYAPKHDITIFNKTNYAPYMYTNKSVDWWLQHFNVETRKGSDFNDSDAHSRFNLMIGCNMWDEFMRRFRGNK